MNRSGIDFTAGGIRSERSQGKWLRRVQKLSDCRFGTILSETFQRERKAGVKNAECEWTLRG